MRSSSRRSRSRRSHERGKTFGVPFTSQHERSKSARRSEEHTSELQSLAYLVCRLLLEKKKNIYYFFFNDTATTEIYTLSLHDALPIARARKDLRGAVHVPARKVEERT